MTDPPSGIEAQSSNGTTVWSPCSHSLGSMGDVFALPKPLSVMQVTSAGNTVIHVRRHGTSQGPRVVLGHGNGLAIDTYFPFWSLLLDEFDVIVFDLRNHGWNDLGSLRDHNVLSFVRDHDAVLDEVARRWGAKPVIGLYHSVSSFAPLLSGELATHYVGLVLFDPPITSRFRPSHQAFEETIAKLVRRIRGRTRRFASVGEYVEVLQYFPTYGRVVCGGHELIAQTTLRPAADGVGYELRCPPEYEAQITAYAGVLAVMVNFQTLDCPIKVIGADPTLPFAYLPAADFGDIVTVDYDFLPETTHFLQLEQPDVCRAAAIAFLRKRNLV